MPHHVFLIGFNLCIGGHRGSGTMQFCGIKIHSITYFIIVMAIGLLVDFVVSNGLAAQ